VGRCRRQGKMSTTRAAGRMGDATMQNQGKRGGQRFGIKGSDISSAFRERMAVVKEKIEPIAGVFRRLVARPGILIMFLGSIIFCAGVAVLVTLSLLMTKCNSGVWILTILSALKALFIPLASSSSSCLLPPCREPSPPPCAPLHAQPRRLNP